MFRPSGGRFLSVIAAVFSDFQSVLQIGVNKLFRGVRCCANDHLDAVFREKFLGAPAHATSNDYLGAELIEPAGQHARFMGGGWCRLFPVIVLASAQISSRTNSSQ